MKKILYVSAIVLFLAQNSFSGNPPDSYLNRAPAIPENICTASFEQVTSFHDKIQALKEEIKKDADSRTEALSSDATRQKVAKQYLGGTGLSASEIEKLQNENMSDAEAAALASRIAAGQTNRLPSADEIGNEQVHLDKTFAYLEDYHRQKEALSREQKQYYLQNVLPIESEKPLTTGSIAAQRKWDADHHQRIQNARKTYCEKFSPKRAQLAYALKSSVKKEMARVRQFEAKQLAQLGAVNQDILLLNIVDSYLDEQKDLYALNVTDYR
ncbi:MAG: hypothetical protein K4571_14330 [Deltaproteobacteria bacterium]